MIPEVSMAYMLAVQMMRRELDRRNVEHLAANPGMLSVEVGRWLLESHGHRDDLMDGLPSGVFWVWFNG